MPDLGEQAAGPWEVYTVLADAGAELGGKTTADVEGTPARSGATGGGCCGTAEAADDASARTVCCAG